MAVAVRQIEAGPSHATVAGRAVTCSDALKAFVQC